MLSNGSRNIGYTIAFLSIFLLFTSNLIINHQNSLAAYPLLHKVSFDKLNSLSTIPINDEKGEFGIPFFNSKRNLEDLQNRLCDNENHADNNIGTSFICDNQSGNNQDKSINDGHNDVINDKITKKMEKLNEKLQKSMSDNGKKDWSQSKNLRLSIEEDNEDDSKVKKNDDKDKNNSDKKGWNDGNNKKNEKQVANYKFSFKKDEQKQSLDQQEGDQGKNKNNNNDNKDSVFNSLNLNIEKKKDELKKKIDKLENKVYKENNKILLKQLEEKKFKNTSDDDDGKNNIFGLNPKIQKIQAVVDKKIEKLKDKIENDRDNQRLIDQREKNDSKDDNKDNKDNKDNNIDGSNEDGKTYDGYGLTGDNSNGNENSDNGDNAVSDDNNFNFVTAGDFGCSKNTQNTVTNMGTKEPELVLALGDLSYHSTADCWFDIMSPLKGKLMITMGHHDTKDGVAKMNQYMKSFELDKPYYSYDYRNVHFLIMASLSDYGDGSLQYNFIKQDLEKASQNKDISWIIVSTYRPLYTSPSEHKADDSIRNLYNPLFEKYGVDLVLSGHNHNYQRTYPLTFNPDDSAKPITTSGVTTGYNSNDNGIVFATVGTGGVNFYTLEGRDPYVASQFAGKFGFLDIDISNGNPDTKLTGTFYDNKGGEIADQFTIEKKLTNDNSEVIYS